MRRPGATKLAVGVTLMGALAMTVTAAFTFGDDGAEAAAVSVAAASRAVGPERHTGPQGRFGQFVVECRYSHSAMDDPIVHPGHPGGSHRHDFFGATRAGAGSSVRVLVRGATTCDKTVDTAAYWHPTLYDHDVAVQPRSIAAYYRAAPGVDRTDVGPFPFGLALIAGNPDATRPQHNGAAGWVCGASTTLASSPPECPASAPLHMALTFPDCWDGEHLDVADHRSQAAYSARGRCPSTHPVHVPQLTVSVTFPVFGTGHDLRLASGPVYSAHGDFLNAWDPVGLAREVSECIGRNAVCDLASNRQEEALFQAR